jgi:hypothetical protein
MNPFMTGPTSLLAFFHTLTLLFFWRNTRFGNILLNSVDCFEVELVSWRCTHHKTPSETKLSWRMCITFVFSSGVVGVFGCFRWRAICRTMQNSKMYNTTLLKILPASGKLGFISHARSLI